MKVCEVDDYSMCGIQRVLAPAWVSQRWQGGHYSQDSVRGQDGMIDRFIFPAHDSWFPPRWFPVVGWRHSQLHGLQSQSPALRGDLSPMFFEPFSLCWGLLCQVLASVLGGKEWTDRHFSSPRGLGICLGKTDIEEEIPAGLWASQG